MNKILLFIAIYILLVIFRNWYIKNVIIKRFIPIHNKLKIMLPKVINSLNKRGIRYVLYSGNLLGIHRHNHSFIPWDDDIDLVILKEKDFDTRIKQVDEDLKESGLYLKDSPFGYAVHKVNKIEDGDEGYIDLFIYTKRDNIWEGNEWSRSHFPREYFKEDMLFPIKTDIFEGINVNVPNDSIGWLKQNYGENCLTNTKITHMHQANYIEIIMIYATSPIPFT